MSTEPDLVGSAADLLRQWLFRIHRMQVAHYEAAVILGRLNLTLGVPVVISSAVVGSALFATLQSKPGTTLTSVLGAVSLAAAILASLQTFLRFGERAEKHRATGSRFAALRAEIEQELSLHSDTGMLGAFMAELRVRWFALNDEAPALPASVWHKVEKRFAVAEPDLSMRNPA